MADACHTSSASNLAPPDPEASQTISQHLNKILESPAFRGSERCKQFLQFVVNQTLEGKAEELKERVIGAQVFGRPDGYETAGDAIVRVKANEVRKRLAQYYAESANRHPVQIELPAGSYAPRFTWCSDAAEETESPSRVQPPASATNARWRFNRWLLAVPIAAIALASFWWLRPGRTSELDQFWGPVLSEPGVPVICLGTSDTYMISGRLNSLLRDMPAHADKSFLVAPNEIVHLANFHVSMGNLYAVMRISELLQNRGRPAQFRPVGELKLDDMRGRPVVLIGAYTNPWTLQTNARLRFQLVEDCKSIRDSTNPARVWRVDKRFPWEPQTVDYAIVSRVSDPSSDSVFITAAGINTFGTQAAGEFLTNPHYWKDLSRSLPGGWQRKNLQIVLETAVVGTTPSPPKVVASYVW